MYITSTITTTTTTKGEKREGEETSFVHSHYCWQCTNVVSLLLYDYDELDRHVLSFNYTQSDTRIVWSPYRLQAAHLCRNYIWSGWHSAGNKNTDKDFLMSIQRKVLCSFIHSILEHSCANYIAIVQNCHIACAITIYALTDSRVQSGGS